MGRLLLTLHPTAAGRTSAAYGGVYVATAVAWPWPVEGQRPDRWDVIGAAVSILGVFAASGGGVTTASLRTGGRSSAPLVAMMRPDGVGSGYPSARFTAATAYSP